MARHLTSGALVAALLAGGGAQAEMLFVKIEDRNPPAEGRFAGADIEAVELYDNAGASAYFAGRIADSDVPPKGADPAPTAEAMLGRTILADWDAPYVHSLNGGSVIAVIDTGANPIGDDFELSVYEVDGSLYDWGGAPDPYRVAVAPAADGPWTDLGFGAGTARFRLDGETAPALSNATLGKIEEALAERPDNDAVPDRMRSRMAPVVARIAKVDSSEQIAVELDAFHRFFHYRDHVVNEHGEADGGRVMASWELMQAAHQRYRALGEP